MSALRFALRQLLKSPGFTIIALLTLALGIGVNTSMYSLVDRLLFRAAPFPEADRLVRIFGTTAQTQYDGFSLQELEEMRAHANSFASLTTFTWWNNTLSEPGQPAERYAAIDASEQFFDTLEVQPMLGRAYTAEEQVPGRNQVAILSHALWQKRFGEDCAIVGRTIRLNAEQVTIIGVMPPTFAYPMLWGRIDLWRPITIPQHIVQDRENRFFSVIGRLAPGVTLEQAAAELAPLAARWARDYPKTSTGRSLRVIPLHESTMDPTSRSIVWMLLGLSGFVLLIACANLANLQLARATANMKDLAIRSALGASRLRLIGHQLVECMILAVVGGGLGVIVTMWTNALLGRSIRIADAGGLPLPVDGRILSAALGISLLTGVLFGLLPAWLASRTDVVTALKQQSRGSTAGRGHHFARHALIVGEVALALVLLAGAGVMIHGFRAFLHQDNGWDTDRVLTAVIHLPEQSTYRTDESRRVAIDRIERRLAQIPGAEATGICTGIPLFGYSVTRPLHVDGQTSEDLAQQPTAGWTMVASDYFATLGIPFLEGGRFPADIRADSPPVVIVNETLAKKFWPDESALGKRVGNLEGDRTVWREIVGVVRDIKFAGNPGRPDTLFQIYKPMVHEPWGYMNLVVRGRSPGAFANELRRAVTDIDSDLAVLDMYTVPEAMDRFQHNLVVINQTLGGFALLGLLLAAVGLYGVISNLVAQRTSEFGIRLALGASRRDVLTLVLGKGMRLALLGLAIGAAGAYGLNTYLGSLLPRMAASDPLTLAGVAAALFAVAVFACWMPARRATRVDPLTALRAD